MKKLTILFLFCCLNFFESFSQDFQWAKQIGQGQTDRIKAMDIDDEGNSYLLGESSSYYFDINPGLAEEIIENNTVGTSGNICYLIKLDPDGNYLWGKVFNMIRNTADYVIDVKIGSDNNIYSLMSLTNYSGNTTISNANIVITKFDPLGNELLVKSIKDLNSINESSIHASSFDLDSSNNVFLTGYFIDDIVLNNSNSSLNLFANGWGNHIIKMNSNFDIIWSKSYDYQHTEFESLKISPDNNINVLYHIFNQSTSDYTENLMKIDNISSNLIWEKSFQNLIPIAFHISQNGNYIISFIRGNSSAPPSDIDPSTNSVLTVANNTLLWLNSNGDFLDYKEYFNNLNFNLIESDDNNNCYFASGFSGLVDVDPSPNTFLLNGYQSQFGESLVVKFDPNRIFEYAFKLGQPNVQPTPYDYIYNLKFSGIKIKNNNEYYCGYFAGYADLDPSLNVVGFDAVHSGVLTDDGFVLKLGPCNTSTPNASNNQSFCSSQNPTIANLSPNSSSIKWYNSLTSIIQLPSSTGLVNGQTYYAANQNGSCPESSRLAVTVTINQTPNPPIISNQVFCESDNATISTLIASGSNIKWYSSLTDTIELPSNHLLTSANYYATQTINNCESNRIAINVTVNSNSLPTVTSPQIFCIQQNATINDVLISGTNVNWYDSSTSGNLLPNTTILIDGTIYYASQTINGCESLRVPVTISIQNTPIPTGNASQEFCATSNPTLSDISVSGTAINWYANNASTTILPNSTALVDGTTYFATQTINGCESVGRLIINASLINTLNANNYSQSFCDDLNDGSENVVLSNYNSNLIASTTGMNFTYYSSYYDAENEIITNQLNTNYTLSIGSTVVYVRLDSANGCHQIVELNLSLFQKPVISIDDVMPICKTSNIIVNAGTGFNSYSWSTGASSQSIVISTAGTYSVTVTKNYGSIICSSTKTFAVVESEIANITSIDTQDWTDSENIIIVSTAINDNYLYSLDGINYQSSNTFSGLTSGFYTVYVKDECGIIDEDVVLLNYPKFFTPNDDGTNDYWRIKFSQYEPNLTVTIFDRYGKIMKVLNPNSIGWDGTYNSTKMISDDYWFVVKREDGREHRAHFTLKR
ncbi:T9SS type B sorting domain-containing protein [Flavobacterium aquatile]|uniref:Ig-like domain-containing protein n=1 Tax=Flavobacterium aquatile LMG 4008 = ATCC 11947 TaxID=1453498 RepID=A0A095V0S4_9FLAO|nr:T9SS type B sorting domain-containing protein [Flavobacterium aquatile]KGD68460.1 hypothetical protein LG45_09275 [Flavobacterium aquatile LMG 4008 = ATCC 11947]OXA68610.1 T9SS C-terminal target domain-containing protein [Flavobacterium aquatile LMG 4008 = ATCC 11947]GEC79234.1 hypothetical protein FAQ01_21040 [Flavobacterium aquatile]